MNFDKSKHIGLAGILRIILVFNDDKVNNNSKLIIVICWALTHHEVSFSSKVTILDDLRSQYFITSVPLATTSLCHYSQHQVLHQSRLSRVVVGTHKSGG